MLQSQTLDCLGKHATIFAQSHDAPELDLIILTASHSFGTKFLIFANASAKSVC